MSPDVNPIQEFADLSARRHDLFARQASSSEMLQDLLQRGIDQTESRLALLAEDPEVREHYLRIGQEPVRAQAELAEVEPMLRELGLDEDIEAKRAEISTMLAAPEMSAAAYLMEISGVETQAVATDTPEADEAAPQETPAPGAVGEEGESFKKQLRVKVDPKNNIKIGDKDSISLSRDMQAASGQEGLGRELRVKAFEFLADNPGMHLRKPIMEACGLDPADRTHQGIWTLHIKPFLEDCAAYGLTFDRTPLIAADTSVEKRYKYGVVDFDVSVERITNPMRPKNETIFTLPDGKEVAGAVGRTLYLLEGATKDKLLETHQVLEDPILKELLSRRVETVDERSVLSGLISRARREIESGTDYVIQSELTDRVDKTTKRRYYGYWMEVNPEEAARYRAERAAQGSAPDQGAEAAGDEQETSTDPCEGILSKHEAALLGTFLVHLGEAFEELGKEPLDEDVRVALQEQAAQSSARGGRTREEVTQLRLSVAKKTLALLSDDEKLHHYVNLLEAKDTDDPRILLLTYLSEFNDDHIEQLRRCLAYESSLVGQWKAGGPGHQGYVLADVRTERTLGTGSTD